MGTKLKYENQNTDTFPLALMSNSCTRQKLGRSCLLTKMEATIPVSSCYNTLIREGSMLKKSLIMKITPVKKSSFTRLFISPGMIMEGYTLQEQWQKAEHSFEFHSINEHNAVFHPRQFSSQSCGILKPCYTHSLQSFSAAYFHNQQVQAQLKSTLITKFCQLSYKKTLILHGLPSHYTAVNSSDYEKFLQISSLFLNT